MSINAALQVFLAKIESTHRIDANPTVSADEIMTEGVEWNLAQGARMIARPAVRPSLGTLKQIFGGSLLGFQINCELKGSGTAGTAPEVGTLLRACGYGETVDPGVSVTYKPVSTGHESASCVLYEDGIMYRAVGCRGNASFSVDVGGKPMASFNLIGHYWQQGTAQAGAATTITLASNFPAVDDLYNTNEIEIIQGTGIGQVRTISDYVGSTKVATVSTAWTTTPDSTSVYAIRTAPIDKALVTPSYDSTVPAPFVGSNFSVDSYAAVISALQIDTNWSVITPPDPRSKSGYGNVQLTKRDPNGSFDPEHTLVATHDFLGKWRSSAAMALATGKIGGTAGNRLEFSLPGISYREPGAGNRDGLRTLDYSFGVHESSTDDEIQLIFT